MAHLLENVQLCFVNKYRQLGVYNMTVADCDDRVELAWVLRDSDDTQAWVSIWRDSAKRTLQIACASQPSGSMAYEDYDFSADEGSIWLHNKHSSEAPAAIVIGMGDMRDLTCTIDVFELPETEGDLIISCTGDFALRIYSADPADAGFVDINPTICE